MISFNNSCPVISEYTVFNQSFALHIRYNPAPSKFIFRYSPMNVFANIAYSAIICFIVISFFVSEYKYIVLLSYRGNE